MRGRDINRFQGTLRNLKFRLRSFDGKVMTELLPDIIGGLEKRIVEMIQVQMWNGKNGREMGGKYGDIIRPLYKPSTIKSKRRKGQPYDRVTLYDTGNFYRKMRVSYNKRYGFFIKSTDSKAPKLIQKYGEEIFRLDHENFNELISLIKRALRPAVAQYLLTGRTDYLRSGGRIL